MTADKLENLASMVLNGCRVKKLKVVTAESCTGGLIAGLLTEIPGSSEVVERGFITYSNEAKQEMLDVPIEYLNTFGAVSKEVALAMAEGALVKSNAQLAVSVTGIAGPGGGSEEKPVGLVHMVVAHEGSTANQFCDIFEGNRTEIRSKIIEAALQRLNSVISD